MAEDSDNMTDMPISDEIERQTIREVIQAQHDHEVRQAQEAHLAARRKQHDDRITDYREGRETQAREAHAQRQKALSEADQRVSANVGDASRSLRAALRAVTEVVVPRHTPHGQEQQRVIRSLQAAMASLRRVGRAEFHETDIDLGAELDAL